MTSALVPFTFNSIKLFTVTINGKHWTRAREVCRGMEYDKKTTKTADVVKYHCSRENYAHKYELMKFVQQTNLISWPRNSRKDDYYLTEEGMYELAFGSKQDKAKEFRKYCCNELFPQVRRELQQVSTEKIEQEHQLAIEDMGREHQQAIEANDTALAMLNDDLDESQREYAILEYRYEQLETRAVPYLEDPKKDNGIVVIQKNNGDEYPYIAICGQQGYVAQKIKNKLIDFPNGQIVVLAETPNAICHYNYLRERGCIEVNPDRVRHFRLGRNLTHQDLLGIQDI